MTYVWLVFQLDLHETQTISDNKIKDSEIDRFSYWNAPDCSVLFAERASCCMTDCKFSLRVYLSNTPH
jgi:hypothetical protein